MCSECGYRIVRLGVNMKWVYQYQIVAFFLNYGIFLVVAISVKALEPTVTIQQGTLTGIKMYSESQSGIIVYLGIPYAKPPIGNLRFLPPEKHPGWERPLFASRFASICPQPLLQLTPSMAPATQQDEDCLYLNIWTTELFMNYHNAPVVVFLEGEGFVSGSPSRFPAQDLAAEGVVVVSVAYRMNVFGFFCLGDAEARGNLGLLDQYLAFVWISENIASFGGDPRSVTLMGHSAGAASIVYHMISPRTANLFHRAIVMSGSITSPWLRSEHPSNASKSIARSLGCHISNDSQAILTCLRTKSTSEILRAYEAQYMNGNWTELVLPVVDSFLPEGEQYLPKSPLHALQEGSFLKIPVLTGVTSHEGTIAVSQWNDLVAQGFTQLRQLFVNSILPSVLSHYGFRNHGSSQEILTLLQWQYVDSVRQGDTIGLLSQLLDFYSDCMFKAPHVRQLTYLAQPSESSDIYAYQFHQNGVDPFRNNFNISGAGHGIELLYLFGPTLMQQIVGRRFTPTEDRLSVTMKRLWVEFMRQGSVRANPYSYGLVWRHYNIEDNNFIVLNTNNNLPPQQPVMHYPSIADTMFKYRISLWNELLPKLHNITSKESQTTKIEATGMHLTTDQPYRSAMYTLIAFVIVLLILLIICVVLLKRRAKERERDLF